MTTDEALRGATRPRIIVDVNAGRLVKWLRALGYDTIITPRVDDGEMLEAARAQGRVLITRDRFIPERRVVTNGHVKVLLLRSDDFREQMHEAVAGLGLDTSGGFSLCIECNVGLTPVERAHVRGLVPEYVFQTQDRFHRCPECRRLYWRGTHWRNMASELLGMTKGS